MITQIHVDKYSPKNKLNPGRILLFYGYNHDEYVIVKNCGFSDIFPHYGTKYRTINTSNNQYVYFNAYELEYLCEKTSEKIQVYITDQSLNEDEMSAHIAKANEKEHKTAQQQAETEKKIKDGKALFNSIIPKEAKALIIAIPETNDCDLQSDYFGVKTATPVVLGWSKHTRDLFSEMRKVAHIIPETAHLAEKNPEFEHREKYSMGAGYYLKKGSRYCSGWTIKKTSYYSDSIYIGMTERCPLKKNNPGETLTFERAKTLIEKYGSQWDKHLSEV